MPCFAAVSCLAETGKAIEEVSTAALAAIPEHADLALLFFSPNHAQEIAGRADEIQARLGATCLLGCSGESIIGNDQELERQPALSLWVARWSRPIRVEPFHLEMRQSPTGYDVHGLPPTIGGADPQNSLLLLLADPYTFRTDVFLPVVNGRFPGLRVAGGIASGEQPPGPSQFLLGGAVQKGGAVGVLLSGPVGAHCIVSQGCRPVGKPLVVTKARDNVILKLDGEPPLAHMEQLRQQLPPRDQQLFERSGHLGAIVGEPADSDATAQHVLLNILGIDRGSGALAINTRATVGQRVRFLVIDADSAHQNMLSVLQTEGSSRQQRTVGALLFTCNQRGTRLFAQPHHDVGAVRAEVADVPVAGFSAAGEIGPVAGRNFVHNFTASIVLFEM